MKIGGVTMIDPIIFVTYKYFMQNQPTKQIKKDVKRVYNIKYTNKQIKQIENKFKQQSFWYNPMWHVLDIVNDTNNTGIIYNLGVEKFNNIALGKTEVDTQTAEQLEMLTGVSAQCWLNLQKSYKRERKI